jgi:MmgE/PrpD C-terminal domain
VHTKEADHSLPYLLAVALLGGDVQPAQLEPKRIEARDVQDLLRKVTVRPDDGFTARYPGEVPSRVTVTLKDGKSYSHEVTSYPAFPTRAFTWDGINAKFDKLVRPNSREPKSRPRRPGGSKAEPSTGGASALVDLLGDCVGLARLGAVDGYPYAVLGLVDGDRVEAVLAADDDA